jgi:hypothetical protein
VNGAQAASGGAVMIGVEVDADKPAAQFAGGDKCGTGT